MRTAAQVQQVRQGRVVLACDSLPAACDACGRARRCALRRLAQQGEVSLEVPQPDGQGAQVVPGTAVVVEVADRELLRAAALAYLPPLAGLLAGPTLVTSLAGGDEPATVVAAVVGLALGAVVSRAWLRRSPPRVELHVAEAP